MNEDNREKQNEQLNSLSYQTDQIFQNMKYYGNNPEVFKYQYIEENNNFTIRIYFYEYSKATIFFRNYKLPDYVGVHN